MLPLAPLLAALGLSRGRRQPKVDHLLDGLDEPPVPLEDRFKGLLGDSQEPDASLRLQCRVAQIPREEGDLP